MKGIGIGGLKKLLVKHGEKALMLLVVACAGYLVYATFSHESLSNDKSATRLTSEANQVDSLVKNFTWQEAVEKAPTDVRIHEALPSAGSVEINPDPYLQVSGGMDPEMVEKPELRKDPKLLTVTEIEGHGVTGLFGFIDAEEAKQRELELMRDAAELERDRTAETERAAADEGGRGGRGGRSDFGGRGGRGGDFGQFGGGLGEDEGNRRPVNVTTAAAGVQLDGTELIRAMSCAVVLAKVPLPEQLAEYKRAFAKTKGYDPSEDYPQYLGYRVERAEVTGEGELDWKLVKFRDGKNPSRLLDTVAPKSIDMAIYNWAGGLEDVYDPRYGHPALTFPLAPLVGRNWGEMAYMAGMPLAADVAEAEATEDTDEEATDENLDGDSLFDQGDDGMGGRGGGEFGGGEFGGRRGGFAPRGGGGEFGGRRGFAPRGGGGEFGGRGGGEFGGRGGGRMGGGSLSRAGDSLKFDENGELVVEVPFVMLRFFDLSVSPGKRYKYRIQLVLANPNYRQPADSLDKSVTQRGKYIEGEWSQPSSTISIPQAGIVRVAESKPPRDGYYNEPEATMLVEAFELDERGNAMQASTELTSVRRGDVMDFAGDVDTLVDQGRFIETIEDMVVDTGIVVLDLAGGKPYPNSRKFKEPTHALMMDASGRMYLRDELDDEEEVYMHRIMFAEPDRNNTGRDSPRGGGRGEFGGGFEF